ncbi:Acyl-CoA-binding domain-containing protein 5, partial [Entomortierella chlamydospora]
TFRHDSTQANLQNLINYNAVWAPTLNSMLVFGGNIDGEGTSQNSLYAYNTAAGWSTPPVSGDIPPPRTLACLVPAYSGTKMILYGGFASSTTNTSGPPLNDIYVLDVATYTWTKGSSSSAGRAGSACAVSGDYLIVWGGYNILASSSLTMVYDIKTDSWITSYAPPPFRPSPRPPSTSNVPLIAGCASGAVVIILLVAGFIWYRKRSNMAHSEAGLGSEVPKQYPQQKQSHDYQVPSGQRPQHIYQPPVMTADPAASYYQQLVMSPDQATGYYQPMKETHHVFQPQIYQPSPVVSDQLTAYSHDITSPQASIVTAATVSPQTNIRNPQDIL